MAKQTKFLIVIAAAVALGLVAALSRKTPTSLATTRLSDGRIFQIEGVTYGTSHRIGGWSTVWLYRYGSWLPQRVLQLFLPKIPNDDFETQQPSLVVWVNAIDPVTGKQIDCQGIRVNFIDKYGDLLEEETSCWFGSLNFWRVGHVFKSYPRDAARLRFQITPWITNVASDVEFANPHITKPEQWSGAPLPQTKRVGEMEIILADLKLRTNGSPKKYWETPVRYWKPIWKLNKSGETARGWSKPEWFAEDVLGNRGEHLGAHQPVLRFSAAFYPSATNTEAAPPIVLLPNTPVAKLATNIIWWNQCIQFGSNKIVALGLFPRGVHVFSEGFFQTNPPVAMMPTGGGAPSGWNSQSQAFSSKRWNNHYTPGQVIYLRSPSLDPTNRLAIRLRDEQGRFFTAAPEPQGGADGIMPFLIKLPDDVKMVTPEITLLKPVQATFTVRTETISQNK